MYDTYNLNVSSGIKKTCLPLVAVPCCSKTVEGVEVQVRVMKNLRMEEWNDLSWLYWNKEKLDVSTRLIVFELMARGFNSIDQAKELKAFLLQLTGWAVNPRKQGKWSSCGVEKSKEGSPIREEARCITRIMASWQRILNKKGYSL